MGVDRTDNPTRKGSEWVLGVDRTDNPTRKPRAERCTACTQSTSVGVTGSACIGKSLHIPSSSCRILLMLSHALGGHRLSVVAKFRPQTQNPPKALLC
jgi:hypothetical protein